jgi:hypothetical protein
MSEFTYNWYSGFLRQCRKSGNVTLLKEVETGTRPQIILRHDIDFDLAAALELSLVEEHEGVRSTYLVLLSTHYYNAASPKSRAILQGLAQRGFEIGLHFDPSVHAAAGPEALTASFRAERAFLESIIGAKVCSVSIHVPTAHGLYPAFAGMVNAYDPRWFGPERYVSDSLRRWRHDPLALIAKARDLGRVQVLCHPIHFGQDETSYHSALHLITEAWRAEAHDYIHDKNQTFRDECSTSTPPHGKESLVT